MEGKEYQVATKEYLSLGKDGYDVFKEGRKYLPTPRSSTEIDHDPIVDDLSQSDFWF